jgi:hypothetical protein
MGKRRKRRQKGEAKGRRTENLIWKEARWQRRQRRQKGEGGGREWIWSGKRPRQTVERLRGQGRIRTVRREEMEPERGRLRK